MITVKKPIVTNLEEELADTNHEFYSVKFRQKEHYWTFFDIFQLVPFAYFFMKLNKRNADEIAPLPLIQIAIAENWNRITALVEVVITRPLFSILLI